jgi:hypothetical protein
VSCKVGEHDKYTVESFTRLVREIPCCIAATSLTMWYTICRLIKLGFEAGFRPPLSRNVCLFVLPAWQANSD